MFRSLSREKVRISQGCRLILAFYGLHSCLALALPPSIAGIKQIVISDPHATREIAATGVVTGFSGWKNSFFLQDDSGGISVNRDDQTPVSPGDKVVVSGTVESGLYAPLVHGQRVVVVGKAKLPRPLLPAYEDLADGHLDSTWIKVKGVVHSAEVTTLWDRKVLLIGLAMPGGSIVIHVLNYADIPIDSLVDSTITVTGVCGSKFNDRGQIVGLRLFAAGRESMTTDKLAPDISRIPKLEMSMAQRYSTAVASSHRVMMAGTVTYQSPEHGLYMQQNDDTVHVQMVHPEEFRPGERVEAFGFVQNFGYSPGLRDAVVRRFGFGRQPEPTEVNPADVITSQHGFAMTRYDGQLIKVKATVVEQLPGIRSELWLLRQGKFIFQAELKTNNSADRISFEPQSEVNVAGICLAEMNEMGDPTSFRLLLRSPSDISVRNSPHWEQSFLFLLVSFLILLGAALLIWAFERRYATYSSGELDWKLNKERPRKMKATAAGLSWLVAGFGLLSFALPPDFLDLYPDVFGSAATRLAISIAAVAVGCSHSRRSWKRDCALSCSFLLTFAGTLALWHHRTRNGALGADHVLQLLDIARVNVAIALCFTVLGASVSLLRIRKLCAIGQLLSLAVAALAFLNLLTRLYGASPSYGVARHTAIPLFLAVCFLTLGTAALLSQPDCGLMSPICSAGRGGLMSRRLVPAVISISVLLGWLRLQGQLMGLFDTFFGLALLALSNSLSFGCIIWISSAVLNRLDKARQEVERVLRQREQQLELLFEKSGIGDFTWDIRKDEVQAHPVVWQLYGFDGTQKSAPSSLFRSHQHPADVTRAEQAVQLALEQRGKFEVEFRVLRDDGTTKWISCRGTVTIDENGQLTGTTGINIDVTEQRQSESALRQTMEAAREADTQFKLGLEFSKVATWRWLPDHDELTWTGPVEEIFEHTSQELSSYLQLRTLVHPDDLTHLDCAMAATLMEGIDFRSEFRIVIGEYTRWIAGRGGAIKDRDGRICGMSGVNLDITKTKVAEERLLESERGFRELADAMPQIVWIADAAGQIGYYNRKWYSYTGSSIGEDISSFIHPDDLENAEQLWRRSLTEGMPFTCERRLKRAEDNTYRWHLSRALPILDSSGKVWRWFGTSTDIEDYKYAQAEIQTLNADLHQRVTELAEKELHYRLLFEGVKDYAIFMLDGCGQVKSWNTGAEQLTGYASAEILGKHFSVFHAKESIEAGYPGLSLAYAHENGRFYQEGWRTRKDGKTFWASVALTSLLDADGRLIGFCKIIRDMTEQRRAMSLLITERQRAELANQAKSTFLASMSHEIRTPMNSILGMADLLSQTELNITQREYVERFQRAGATLLTLINDILDLSRIESGHFELEEVQFDLEEVAQRAVDLIAHKAKRNHVNLALRLVPGISTNVMGDPNRLQQILLNLLGNATKFTERGEILLTICPHRDQARHRLEFRVSDTGIGIAKNKLSCIFDDFVQAESSTTRRFGGTGLGLGIAERLVRKMGGTLTVESEQRVGSTFIFDVLLKPGTAKPEDRKVSGWEELAGRRILIVDGNDTNRLVYSEMCSASGTLPQATPSVREAITILLKSVSERNPFAVVLLDRDSNDMDAFQALESIRGAGFNLPVILTSVHDDTGEARRATTAGFAGYLIKPTRRASLLKTIASSLRSPSTTPEQSQPGRTLPVHADVHSRIRIMIADDSEDNRFLIDAYLKDSIYEPEFTINGELAVELFQKQQFDLILMDVQMPKMDGLQATAAIRALERAVGQKPIPIIALTANAMADDIEKSKSAGCNAHLAKPISKAVLFDALVEWQPETH